jgi:aspartyl-tRNA(Asn)/glutamyl-tRNA(Gln) amidotransferase subunit A
MPAHGIPCPFRKEGSSAPVRRGACERVPLTDFHARRTGDRRLGLRTIAAAVRDLKACKTTSRALVEQCLEQIGKESGEGRLTFLKVDAEGARRTADLIDWRRSQGSLSSHSLGIPISIKDLFDNAGDVTSAGSRALSDGPAASTDAFAVARLKQAGFIIVGRTNMTELAYSGLGINPHFGTPANPFERSLRRIPGGSSSGAAISVTDGMSLGAIGSDTGGSCRIPAALTGIVGFKPTAKRVPRTGVLALSTTLDSIGPLAPSVSCCALLDSVLSAADGPEDVAPSDIGSLRFAVPQTIVLEELEPDVAAAFDRAVGQLSQTGARIKEIDLPEFAQLLALNANGGFHAPEGFDTHKTLLAEKFALVDPRVSSRLMKGGEMSAAEYVSLSQQRARIIASIGPKTASYDALLMPTVPFIAPPIRELEDDQRYHHFNRLSVRNCVIINMLDRCAVSIPCHEEGRAPVGLMVAGEHGADRWLLSVARTLENVLEPLRRP